MHITFTNRTGEKINTTLVSGDKEAEASVKVEGYTVSVIQTSIHGLEIVIDKDAPESEEDDS